MKYVSRLLGTFLAWRRLASIGHALDPDQHDAVTLRKRLVLMGWVLGSCHVLAVVGVYALLFVGVSVTKFVVCSGLMAVLMGCACPRGGAILRRIDDIDDDGRSWSDDCGGPPREPAGGDDLDWTRFEEQLRAYSHERQLSTSGH